MKRFFVLFGVYLSVSMLLAACSGGGGGGDDSAQVQTLKAFVTSTSYDGNLGGLAGADAKCQARATATGLTGTFRAWLSDDSNDAYCRVHNLSGKKSANCGRATLPAFAGPWIRTDGFPFGGPIANILEPYGIIYVPVRYDEYGVLLTPNAYFTATNADGALDSSYPSPCANWNSNASKLINAGSTEGTTCSWLGSDMVNCSDTRPLLCLQSGAGKALPGHTSYGKKVFVTSTTYYNGNLGGLAGADTECRNRALDAGLANASDFKAWLSDGSTNAKDRLTTDGPWVRIDGVKVANNKADLIDGSLFTSISVTESGMYLGCYAVWTGTGSNGITTGNHCNNWTDDGNTNTFYADAGYEAIADEGWTIFFTAIGCNAHGHLYCFED